MKRNTAACAYVVLQQVKEERQQVLDGADGEWDARRKRVSAMGSKTAGVRSGERPQKTRQSRAAPWPTHSCFPRMSLRPIMTVASDARTCSQGSSANFFTHGRIFWQKLLTRVRSPRFLLNSRTYTSGTKG